MVTQGKVNYWLRAGKDERLLVCFCWQKPKSWVGLVSGLIVKNTLGQDQLNFYIVKSLRAPSTCAGKSSVGPNAQSTQSPIIVGSPCITKKQAPVAGRPLSWGAPSHAGVQCTPDTGRSLQLQSPSGEGFTHSIEAGRLHQLWSPSCRGFYSPPVLGHYGSCVAQSQGLHASLGLGDHSCAPQLWEPSWVPALGYVL